MAFFKTSTAPAEEVETADLDNFSQQAAETCQTCGYKMSRDESGALVCRHEGCPNAVSS